MFDTSWLIINLTRPGMNGLRLQGQLEATGCRIPIVFTTAYEEKESRQRAMHAVRSHSRKAFYGRAVTPNDSSALRQEKDGWRRRDHAWGLYGKGRQSFVD